MLSFCFINPKSGNTVGKQMLQNLNSIIEIQFYTSNITCFFADIHSCEPLLNIITQVVDKNIKIHIFIAGGDGTAKWVVDLLLDLHISLDRFQFSIIPFGTGNDLSRWLNCGKRINEIKPEACIPMMLTWILERIFAPVKPLSLWKINVETYAEGYVESGKGIVYQDFSSTMISLMSIGLMGAVGMEFEKTNQRGSKRWRNILGYALMSGKYLFAKSNEMNLSKSLKGMKTNSKWISFQRSWLEENSPIEIIIQNVPSMWGRSIDLWKRADLKPGILHHYYEPETDFRYWTQNDSCDKKLEVFVIETLFEYLTKQSKLGQKSLKRIAQVENGLDLEFHPTSVNEYCSFMIDGEFYRICKPKTISLEYIGKMHVSYYVEN